MRLLHAAALAAFLLPALHVTSSPAAPLAPSILPLAPEARDGVARDTIVLTRDALRFSADRLLIPVVGIERDRLKNSFTSPRSGGRVHRSIDIMAPRGTPVVAVADGEITRRSRSRLGGITLYLDSPEGGYSFYYAHLARYASGATVGTLVQQGDTLGYVGTTGNARSPHLHFQVLKKSGRGRGTPVNPYTLLRRSEIYGTPEVRG